jgi:uncharacterized Zn finger protein
MMICEICDCPTTFIHYHAPDELAETVPLRVQGAKAAMTARREAVRARVVATRERDRSIAEAYLAGEARRDIA